MKVPITLVVYMVVRPEVTSVPPKAVTSPVGRTFTVERTSLPRTGVGVRVLDIMLGARRERNSREKLCVVAVLATVVLVLMIDLVREERSFVRTL